jgi:hypothetical protein
MFLTSLTGIIEPVQKPRKIIFFQRKQKNGKKKKKAILQDGMQTGQKETE